ncbi:unnamed protein product [Protopolystoma xenopodis]|uniref:Uncharacterized protein n=1 Tax=Protopolystoma xenopodis TaxID=117903 RepID=A0A3S5CLJ6_9PLAT|nr:unnamed protein product [Protopolystoma xenopodis]
MWLHHTCYLPQPLSFYRLIRLGPPIRIPSLSRGSVPSLSVDRFHSGPVAISQDPRSMYTAASLSGTLKF